MMGPSRRGLSGHVPVPCLAWSLQAVLPRPPSASRRGIGLCIARLNSAPFGKERSQESSGGGGTKSGPRPVPRRAVQVPQCLTACQQLEVLHLSRNSRLHITQSDVEGIFCRLPALRVVHLHKARHARRGGRGSCVLFVFHNNGLHHCRGLLRLLCSQSCV